MNRRKLPARLVAWPVDSFAYRRPGPREPEAISPFQHCTLTQLPLPILPAPVKHLIGVPPCARATLATDASGSNVSSTIRRFSSSERRLRCGSRLTMARSEVSTYSPSGHFQLCPRRAIFLNYTIFVHTSQTGRLRKTEGFIVQQGTISDSIYCKESTPHSLN